MLIKTSKELTRISDNEVVNNSNYLESLGFIDNLYGFLNKLKKVISIENIHFLPTFKGKYTCEKFNICSSVSENQMKYFCIESESSFEDKEKKEIEAQLTDICRFIEVSGNTAKFLLK